ncbi:MAG: YihA family ribosome biogenesis GTP-binding protein [Bacteroidetes bacterium]|uniref:Probable GTP-binding protein EngB n=1 Tax=Candidatus Cryptobacteroides gallistercoris TaxID=2840765 RepID=A0A940DM38_9BACT|nr:YihA family ribosome biogenesis GTP-binding protein [Candidatus Cryptobacteroides gallistercoris]
MKISEALFAGSSTRVAEKPARKFPEFAFIGRSNVGKSSLINMLCNNRRLAQTSSTPGKTKLVNHYLINGQWYLVDLPGYGYAKMSKTGRQKLEQVIRNYLNFSAELHILFVLIDSRHDIGKIDMDFLTELGTGGIPFAIIFTKADKLGPNALAARMEKNRAKLLEFWEELPPLFVCSSETGAGKEEILDYIGRLLDEMRESAG